MSAAIGAVSKHLAGVVGQRSGTGLAIVDIGRGDRYSLNQRCISVRFNIVARRLRSPVSHPDRRATGELHLLAPPRKCGIATIAVDLQDARKGAEMRLGPFRFAIWGVDIGDHWRVAATHGRSSRA